MAESKLIPLAERLLGDGRTLPENIRRILSRMEAGKSTWAEAQTLASWAGYRSGLELAAELSGLGLEGAELAQRVELAVTATLNANYELVSAAAQSVQQGLNVQAGIGLKVQKAGINKDRVSGLVRELTGKARDAEALDGWRGVLAQQVENFARSVVDDTVRANVDSHYRAGLRPKIVRRSSGGCCAWCDALAGSYRYPDEVPDDLYRRHTNCDCVVTYDPADGTRQDVWSKAKWVGDDPTERIAAINELNAQRSAKAQARAIARKERDSAIKALMQERGMSAKQASIYYNMRIRPSKNI